MTVRWPIRCGRRFSRSRSASTSPPTLLGSQGTNMCTGLTRRSRICQRVDRFRELPIAVRDFSRIVAGQTKIDAVPHAREFRVMVDFLRVHCDARQECESLAEIPELERADQRLAAVLKCPALGNVTHGSALRLARPILQWNGGKSGGAAKDSVRRNLPSSPQDQSGLLRKHAPA